MLNALIVIIIAVSILFILFFAYKKKDKLATTVSFVILTSIAISMAITGMIGIINNIDFLSFLVGIYRFLNDLIVFIELGFILFLMFVIKLKTKHQTLTIAIIVYVVLRLLIELNLL
jgi:hypothetical protein